MVTHKIEVEKAISVLKVHASTVETRERLVQILELGGIESPEKVIEILMKKKLIKRLNNYYDLTKIVCVPEDELL